MGDISCFVFDLYGTLANIRTDEEAPAFRRAIQRRFAALCHTRDEFWPQYLAACARRTRGQWRDCDVAEVFAEILGRYNPDLSLYTLLDFVAYFRTRSRLYLRAYAGAKRTVRQLRRRGAKVYLLSNAQSCFTLAELDHLGLLFLFDGIALSSQFGYAKPSPMFFEAALSQWQVDCAHAIYIGNDIACDLVPAARAGMASAYIHTAASPAEDTLQAARVYTPQVFEDHRSLFDYLLSLCPR